MSNEFSIDPQAKKILEDAILAKHKQETERLAQELQDRKNLENRLQRGSITLSQVVMPALITIQKFLETKGVSAKVETTPGQMGLVSVVLSWGSNDRRTVFNIVNSFNPAAERDSFKVSVEEKGLVVSSAQFGEHFKTIQCEDYQITHEWIATTAAEIVAKSL